MGTYLVGQNIIFTPEGGSMESELDRHVSRAQVGETISGAPHRWSRLHDDTHPWLDDSENRSEAKTYVLSRHPEAQVEFLPPSNLCGWCMDIKFADDYVKPKPKRRKWLGLFG